MFLLHRVIAVGDCPPRCRCTAKISDCSYSGLRYTLPWNASHFNPFIYDFKFHHDILNMTGNEVSYVEEYELFHYDKLTNVSFRNNIINKINPFAFSEGGRYIIYLDLS
jgi:hypothetical protein